MAQATFVEDVLPPEGIYDSRESLLEAINSWARPRGYAFTTGKSTKTPNGRIKVVFACDRNKQPPNTSVERVRRTSSRRTDYKFSVLAKQSLDGNSWVLSYRPDPACASHNHPPSEDPSAHPAHRRIEEPDATAVSNLAISGTTPQGIRTYLQNHSETLATQRDIYNLIAGKRRDKTNKHHMPLLDMIGVDSCQRSFCIAFASLSGESEEDYMWALEHLRSLYQRELPTVVLTDRCLAAMNAAAVWFPSSKALLCLWHVNKAILQHCRPLFVSKTGHGTDEVQDKVWDEFYAFWHSIVASRDEKTFDERLAQFEAKYGDEYLEDFGNIATSRKVAWGT